MLRATLLTAFTSYALVSNRTDIADHMDTAGDGRLMAGDA